MKKKNYKTDVGLEQSYHKMRFLERKQQEKEADEAISDYLEKPEEQEERVDDIQNTIRT